MKIKFLRDEKYRTVNPRQGQPGQFPYLTRAHAAGEVLDTDDAKFREWLQSVNPASAEADLDFLATQYAQRWLRRNSAVPEEAAAPTRALRPAAEKPK